MTMNASSDKLTELRERGWVRLEGAVNPETVAAFLKTVHVLSTAPASAGARVPFLNQGHQMIYNLQGKDFTVLRTFLSHPALRSIFTSVLNDEWYRSLPAGSPNYILRSLLARSSGPASMPLHIDSFIPANSSFAWSAQAAIVLEDQTVENGCTVAVPGSHRFDRYADQAAITTAEPIPSKAGDIVIWDSRLWHGAGGNKAGKTRWSVIATFSRWWLKQNYDLPRSLPEEYYARLTNEEKAIMGYCSIPPRDESDRIDLKGGYEDLRPRVADYR